MNWLEVWFGISPDGGSGTTEMLYAGAAILLAAVIGYSVRRRRARA